MKTYKFRNHTIKRNPSLKFNNYHTYISNDDYMKKDFNGRCAYCNAPADLIMVPFEVDHFVPRKVFKDIDDTQDYKYDNLMYCCKKCNLAKRAKHEGNVYDNTKFYNPVTVDMNEYFYIQNGRICSEDSKGKDIIIDLKLYRPIHRIVWIIDRLEYLIDKIKKYEEMQKCSVELLKEKDILLDYHYMYNKVLKIYYKTNEKKDKLIEKRVVIC